MSGPMELEFHVTMIHVMLLEVRKFKIKMAKSLMIPLTVTHEKAKGDRVGNMSMSWKYVNVNLRPLADGIVDSNKDSITHRMQRR